MNDELERIWKEDIVADLRLYHGVCQEGQRATTET
jgi:hypothetical protein